MSFAEGPTLEAMHRGSAVVVRDLSTDARWPRLGQLVADKTPVRAVLAYPLRGTGPLVTDMLGGHVKLGGLIKLWIPYSAVAVAPSPPSRTDFASTAEREGIDPGFSTGEREGIDPDFSTGVKE